MPNTDLKAVTRRFYDDLISRGDLELLDELVHDDFIEHEEFPGLPPGKEGLRTFVTLMRDAFPDLDVAIEDMVAEGDKVASRVRFSGTHRGEFMGIPPTERKIDVAVIDIVQYRDGKASHHWGLTDQMAMMKQLGVGG